MDKDYYFVVEASGAEDGPFVLAEIAGRLRDGSVSQDASLARVGETRKTPIGQIAAALAGLQPLPARPRAGSQVLAIQPDAAPAQSPPSQPRRRWPWIFSYGYPGSSLANHAGLVSNDGKILSLVMFPAHDDRFARI